LYISNAEFGEHWRIQKMNSENSLIDQPGTIPLVVQFPLLATSPNGVARLRELILQLAVMGKLGTQDASDEPAAELMKKINEDRQKIIKDDKTKKSKNQAYVLDNGIKVQIPDNWVLSHVGEISDRIHYGYTASADETNKRIRLLRITDIQNNRVNWDIVPGCEIDDSDFQLYSLKAGDLLIARTGGTVGKSYLVRELPVPAVFASYLIRIIPNHHLNPEYVKLFADSPFYWDQLFQKCMGTGQPNVNGTALRSLLIPLPPLAEQHRIVEKVDRLMALCDTLEVQQRKEHEQSVRHGTAALMVLQNAKNSEDLEKWWRHIEENFGEIFNCIENVGTLRQKIRKLAVRGRLVEQEPTDEPASILLEKIREEKDQLINEGKLQKDRPSKLPNGNAAPYSIPNGWEWAQFGQITFNRDGERIPIEKAERATRQGSYDYYGASGVIDTIDEYLFDKPLLLIGEDGANLVNRSTPIAFIAYGKYWVNNHAHVIDGISLEFLQYLELYINSIDLVPYLTGMAQPKMNQAKMNSIPVPLPPPAEQHRIVAKVDALMVLCDNLEAQIRDREAAQERFAKATINQIVNAPVSTVQT